MNPRTKLHFEIVNLSHNVKDLESEFRNEAREMKIWAYKNCLKHKGFATKSKVLCLDCGETFAPDLVSRKKATCPHCQTKLSITESRCSTDKQETYFASAEIVGEYQVIRNFQLIGYYKKGKPVEYFLNEILQYWIRPDLKTTMFGKRHTLNNYVDSWSIGPMEIQQENRHSWHGSKYDVFARNYYPKSIFKNEYLKFGINHNLHGLTFLDAIKLIPSNPKLETLLKAKQYSLLSAGENWKINSFWSAIKICLRNKYKVTDASIYFDYLELLRYFKKDLHNSKYVCPKNLKSQHDKLVKRKRKIQIIEELNLEKIAVIERQKRLELAIVQYVERVNKFFKLEFKEGAISIQLLKSIDEFKEEGDELKHCIYTNEYYTREHSLIFSAKVNGIRTETIELDLDKMKIEQSRGISNNPSKYNKEIVVLMTKNIPKIKQILKQLA